VTTLLQESSRFCRSGVGVTIVDPTKSSGTMVNGLVNHTMTNEEGTWTRNRAEMAPAKTVCNGNGNQLTNRPTATPPATECRSQASQGLGTRSIR